MAENTENNSENAKKIRELEDFEESTPLSPEDYLIIATNTDADGDGANERLPLTKKTTIAAAVEVYNNSIATPPSEPPDPSIPVWSNTTSYNVGDKVVYNNKVYECTLAHTSSLPLGGSDDIYWKIDAAASAPDPEDQPGYEEVDPETGETVKRVTTPINGGNLDNFLSEGGGVKTVDFCQNENKEEVACDGSEGVVKYKTKKLVLDVDEDGDDSRTGFNTWDPEFLYSFPKTLREYKDGSLVEIYYDIGKLLEHTAPMYSSGTVSPKWFEGTTAPLAPNFGLIIWANSDAVQNFDLDTTGSWVFNLGLSDWLYIDITSISLNSSFVESYWMWNAKIGWFWSALDIYPYIYINSDITGSGSTTGWVYASNQTGKTDLSSTMYFYSLSRWVDLTKSDFSPPATPPSTTPGPPPSRGITELKVTTTPTPP